MARYAARLCACGRPATRRTFNIATCERCYEWDQAYKSQHLVRHQARDDRDGGLVEHAIPAHIEAKLVRKGWL